MNLETVDTTSQISIVSDFSDENNSKSRIRKNKKITEDLQERKDHAIKEMNFLLKNSQKYSSFFLKKLTADAEMNLRKTSSGESDLEELKRKQDESLVPTNNNLGIKYFVGNLHPYQFEGLKWLKLLFENSINGILADEMGLGKTIQVIALICNLIEQKVPGPYLVVAPLSTLPNWVAEFNRFAPNLPVILFYGSLMEREDQKRNISNKYQVEEFYTYPIVITSYQYPVMEQKFLQGFRWQYIVVDEGHRIKNFQCKLMIALKRLFSLNRLILTGTPLQNNLVELWSLLNFLLPQIFPNAETFSSLFEIEDFEQTDKIIQQEQSTNIISTIHGVLAPFMLRRQKVDVLQNMVPKKEVLVYCPLTDNQKNLYKYVLQKNIKKLKGHEEESEVISKKRKCTLNKKYSEPDSDDEFTDEFVDETDKLISKEAKKNMIYHIKMCNPTMLLKKIVNHPFTVHCPVIPGTREMIIDEEIVNQSGKILVLDAMLSKLKERGHKVLLFCTMTSVLDFIEDFIIMRSYKYCRLDGRVQLKIRQEDINSFNSNPDVFIFLISTRAGGLGINLAEADTVILYDRDWNPQVDLQAQDRCHRIGQKNPVMIYSLIAKGTIDERIVKTANAKRKLEKIVIKKGKFTNLEESMKNLLDIKELEELLKSVDENTIVQTNSSVFTDEELNQLLDRTELYEEMKNRNIYV